MTDTSSTGLGSVDWGATAKLTLVRGLSSAVVLCAAATTMKGIPIGDIPGLFVQLVIAITIGAPLYHLIVRGIRSILGSLPFVSLACSLILLACSVMVAIGDPIVFAINKRFPELLGIADFKLFNFVPAIFVQQ
jgi:hypothetical protein